MNVLLRPTSPAYRGPFQCSQRVSAAFLPGKFAPTIIPWQSPVGVQRNHSVLMLAEVLRGVGSRIGGFAAKNFSFNQQRVTRSFSKALIARSSTQDSEKMLANTDSVAQPSSKTAPTVHENIYTIPNFLTFTRLFAAPAIGYYVLTDCHQMAFGLFAYAGITDMLDGWIARKWKQQTVVGTIVDPMADKMLMTILTVCLAMKDELPVWIASIIIGRDIGLAISAIYYRYISLPPPKTFRRYCDFSLPSAEVRPIMISKVNTALQLGLIGLTVAAPVLPYDLTTGLTYFQYVVALTTIWSGASYIFSKDAVKILGKQNKA